MTPLPSILPWRKPPPYDADDLANDVNRVLALYRREGFYHAVVTPEVTPLSPNEVAIKMQIEEGPCIKVSKINLSLAAGEEPIDLKLLLKDSPIKIGQRFSENQYANLKKNILNYFLNNGYAKARLEGDVLVNAEENWAEINLQVWPSPICRFGQVEIKGQTETPESLIRHHLTFQPGELFSLEKIYQSQEKLFDLDLFQNVNLTAEEVPEEQRVIPVTVEVQERKKRSLKLGVGYGSEDQFRGRVVLRYRNLGGGGRVLELSSKYSRLETRLEGSFRNPQLFNSGLDFVFNTGINRRYLPGFTDKAFFTRAVLERDFPWNLKGYVGHGLEYTRPFNISDDTLQRLQATEAGKLYRASMLLLGLNRNTMDNPTDPQKGGSLSLLNEFAPQLISPQLQFIRSIIEVRQYQNLGWKNLVLAGRVKFGLIEPMQNTPDIPIFRRFFSGGSGSVRGYRLDYLGPRDQSGNPIGGDSVLEGNLEVRFPIYKDIRGVTFLDCGNVFLRLKNTNPGQLKYGSGVGLRYQTLVGPLGVDVAFPLNPIDPHRDKFQVYFSIGQSF
jgi:outer membrane protein assembly complex protein YaeT